MKTPTLRLLGFTLLVAVFPHVALAADVAAELNGKLVALHGKAAVPFDSHQLAQTKYIALYFSAGWCGPCHKFTPELVKFYNEMKPNHPEFEVVFMSEDQGANAMEKYMGEMSMPWPALRFAAAKSSPLRKYAGSGIPDLVVLNEKGEVLSDSFAGKEYLGPSKVVGDLRKLLTGDGSEVATNPSSAKIPPATAANQQPSQNVVKSPSGTNWDEVFKKKSP
jgi:nucleoredoxin